MVDHLDQSGITDQGRALGAERVAARAQSLGETQRLGGEQQPLGLSKRQAERLGQGLGCLRAAGQYFEQAKPNASRQGLRIDEAGDQIE
jgi:hypothetical protein